MAASSQNYYQLYMNDVLTLAATIVIKSEDTAQGLNQYIIDKSLGAVDTTDETTWKYYMNLSGQYHPTDTIMTVTSMDTLEEIDFTVANLAIHTNTARDYVYGSRFYLELVARYPDQQMLILGILNPVDITTAINAANGQILMYDPSLVEVNEYSFIRNLQAFIDGYYYRWYNASYAYTDELYPAAYLGTLYLMLIPAILSIRNNACGTNEAHSFHVREYLASNGSLDDYYDYLTTNQSLWLYRNIKYIQRHPGAQATFDALVENMLTARNLPLARYTMKHDTTPILDTLKPALTFEYDPINTWAEVDAKTEITLDQLMTKEQGLARDNTLYQSDYETIATALMSNSLRNTVDTKIFESSVVDYTDSYPITRTALLFNEWLMLASQGVYTAYVEISNPVTSESINLQAGDAFCFALYCYAKTTGVTLDAIPKFVAHYVAINPLPSVDTLMAVVDRTLVPSALAQQALSWMPTQPASIITTDAFYAYVDNIFKATMYQRNMYSYQQHYDRRGMVKNMIDSIFCDAVCSVGEVGTSYTTWLSEMNIHSTDWTELEYESAYLAIVKSATGADLTSNYTLAQIQAAMIGIMQTLSSYSVQFIATINKSNIRLSDDGYIRLGNRTIVASAEYDIVDTNVGVQGVVTSASQYERFQMIDSAMINVDQSATILQEYPLPGLIQIAPIGSTYTYELNINNVRFHPDPPLVPNSEGLVPVVGLEYFLALTKEQQQQFRDVYNTPYDPIVKWNLERVISTYYASGLVWNQTLTDLKYTIVENPSEGLVWYESTGNLTEVIRYKRALGLHWNPTKVPLSGSILETVSPGLTWVYSPVPIDQEIRNPSNGLVYYPGQVDLSQEFLVSDATGLTWPSSGFDLLKAIPVKHAHGLFFNQSSAPLYQNFKITEGRGLTYTYTPIPTDLNGGSIEGLTYSYTGAHLTSVSAQSRGDGLLWPNPEST